MILCLSATTVAENPADPNAFRYGLGIERVRDPWSRVEEAVGEANGVLFTKPPKTGAARRSLPLPTQPTQLQSR
jgi:hypothetical protein